MMKITNYCLSLCIFFCTSSLFAQMPNGLDTLYGNEWIVSKSSQSYLRIPINEDGFYRINIEDIQAHGWPTNTISATDFQLFHEGKIVHLYNSNESNTPLTTEEYLVFYGEKNRGKLDQYLYRNQEEQQLNPEYSLISDESSYYLTYQSGGGINYTTINNDLSNLPLEEPYVWRTVKNVHGNDNLFMKEYDRSTGTTLYFSHFGIGEGYGSRSINQLLADGDTTQTETLVLNNAFPSGPSPILETRYTAALFEHNQRLSVNDIEIRTDVFNGWKLLNITENLPNSVLNEGEARIQWTGSGGVKDEVSVGFTKITYPAIPSADDNTFFEAVIPANGLRQYLEVSNFGASTAVVYDLTNALRIPVNNIVDGLLKVSLPASSEDRQIIIIEDENNLASVDLHTANLNLPNTNNANYIILTNSLLRDNGDPVQAYADYRASMVGGAYRTAVVNIDDLYDQFAYGIQLHPLAIRNFVAWQRKINPDFKYLFIIGKGREYKDVRTATALETALGNTLFVPSFGYPASDNLLVSDINKPTPLVSIGRLAAINSAEVALYLNKIRSKEALASNEQTIEAKAWMKDIMHLGGGSTPSEKQIIKNNLTSMAHELEQGKFGANVTSFYKASSDPIQISITDQIFDRINDGVSIITFFGHSNAGSFDFNIDNPDNYENAPKYPLLISLGCYSGNMYANFRSIGERFIFLEDGGAGTFAASRGLGFIHSLNDFNRYFYKQMSNDYYGQPIGDGIRVTIQHFEDRTDNAYGTMVEQFSLQGDPAFKLNPAPAPDFVFDAKKTRFRPSIVNAQKDSFEVFFTLQNIGQAVDDTIELTINRQFPSGEMADSSIRISIPAPAYNQEIRLTLPTEGKTGVGINRFFVAVNTSLSEPITESPSPSAQMNNILISSDGKLGIPFFIINNNALPVWPPDYALVGNADITLKASTADAFAPERTYFMELDTTPVFIQPISKKTIVQKGGVVRWTPDYNWQDSTVYYWRITPDSLDIGTPEYVWEGSSFTYINGIEPGWGQGHWGQYAENELNPLEVTLRKQLDFVQDVNDLSIRNVIYTIGNSSATRPNGFVNGKSWSDFFRWNIRPSLQIVVVDTLGVFWRNHYPGEYGSVNTTTQHPIACFSFPVQTLEQRSNIINFLTNVIPNGHTVIIYNAIRNENQDLWIHDWAADSISLEGKNIFNTLEEQGALQIRSLLESPMRPYLFSFIKGEGMIAERITEAFDDFFVYSVSIPGRWTEGKMSSHKIGPANEWDKLTWHTPPQSENDTLRIQLYGLLNDGTENLLMDSVAMNGELDLSPYSINEYPYLKLNFQAEDRIDKSCPPMSYWHIHYQGLPDLAIDRNTDFEFHNDSLQLGEKLRLKIAISNISDLAIDSTTVLFKLQSEGQGTDEWTLDLPALAPDEYHVLTTNRNTDQLSGSTQLQISVNPSNTPQERLKSNNQTIKGFEIINEVIAPIIDLTFDGQQILSGDLISAKPFIQIILKDENPYLLLNDSSLFTIKLKDPFGNEKTILLNGQEAVFIPATSTQKNEAKIEWQPDFTDINGVYLLSIRGRDRIGNEPRLLYETTFEVIKEQMLSNVLPYPNPFTSSTQFVYTLTGIDTPPQYKIQIMTVSGRIVREINQDELGPLQVGTHITDYVWDGTDTYGDRLATGTYLYRVIAVDQEGNNLDHYDNGTDAFFKNKLGKIVILR